jgi:hypothetical protein
VVGFKGEWIREAVGFKESHQESDSGRMPCDRLGAVLLALVEDQETLRELLIAIAYYRSHDAKSQ